MNFLGRLASEARAQFGEQVQIMETAPPFLPRGYEPQWGEWRVVRQIETADGRMELLVARELIGETRAPRTR